MSEETTVVPAHSRGSKVSKVPNRDEMAKRSLLYRPSTGKIIDIAPIQSNPTFTVPPKR